MLEHGARTLWHVAHLFGYKPAPSMPMRISFGEEATYATSGFVYIQKVFEF